VDRVKYDEYIDRFNKQDATAFDDYFAPHFHMQNGTLEFEGQQGMRRHYAMIWETFTEDLNVERFVSDDKTVAVQMWTHFTANRDNMESPFGPVVKGETFDFRGLIMYRVEEGQFVDCKVAYNSFRRTDLTGTVMDLGIPH
jgi:hypothetical protein